MTKKELIDAIVDTIQSDGEHIMLSKRGKDRYIKKYKLKFNTFIVNTVINAFLRVILKTLSEGKSIKIMGYFKIEPKLYKGHTIHDSYLDEVYDIPDAYRPKITWGKKVKRACKKIPMVENQ